MRLISRVAAAVVFSALLAGDSIAQQVDGSKTRKVAAVAPGTTGSGSQTVKSGSPDNTDSGSRERERMLLERIEKLERRLAELESRSAIKPPNEPAQPLATTTDKDSLPTSPKPGAATVEAAVTDASPSPTSSLADEPKTKEPFAFADFTWLTGSSRQKESPLKFSDIFTGELRVDAAFHHSFNHPKDDTIGGSTEAFRSGEVQLTDVAIGGDFNYKNVRGRLLTQFGMYSQTQPRNDASPGRGQWNLDNAYRYISEAYGGYHIDKLNGINVDAGIFLSYIGLYSFYQFDNWSYQPSYVSSNTPWYFQGVRVQIFLSDKLKIEPWIINGWQSYGKFNKAPGVGGQVLWRPNGAVSIVANNYWGTDTLGNPDRKRIHTDNSVQVKYLDRPENKVSKAAFTVTVDAGCEYGGGVKLQRGLAG